MASLFRTSLRTALRQQHTPIASSSKLCTPSTLRYNSTSSSTSTNTSTSTPSDAAAPSSPESAADAPDAGESGVTPVKYSYFVPRVGKTLDSLPVYTDVRNGGTRIITVLRKIQGSVADLRTDLALFLDDTYASNDPSHLHDDSPLKVNKKPLRPHPGRKMVPKTAHPTYIDPVQTGKVAESGQLKIRGNRVEHVKAFLESRGF